MEDDREKNPVADINHQDHPPEVEGMKAHPGVEGPIAVSRRSRDGGQVDQDRTPDQCRDLFVETLNRFHLKFFKILAEKHRPLTRILKGSASRQSFPFETSTVKVAMEMNQIQ